MGISHDERCKKYKQQIENLKLDLIDLQDECDLKIRLNREEKLMIYTGLEMYWKQEFKRENQKASQAKKIDILRQKIIAK
jgi:hypothetical protein